MRFLLSGNPFLCLPSSRPPGPAQRLFSAAREPFKAGATNNRGVLAFQEQSASERLFSCRTRTAGCALASEMLIPALSSATSRFRGLLRARRVREQEPLYGARSRGLRRISPSRLGSNVRASVSADASAPPLDATLARVRRLCSGSPAADQAPRQRACALLRTAFDGRSRSDATGRARAANALRPRAGVVSPRA